MKTLLLASFLALAACHTPPQAVSLAPNDIQCKPRGKHFRHTYYTGKHLQYRKIRCNDSQYGIVQAKDSRNLIRI